MSEKGYPPRQSDHPSRAGRARAPQQSRNSDWQMLGAFEPPPDQDPDLPPWAIPGGIEPMRPTGRPIETIDAEPVAAPGVTGRSTPLTRTPPATASPRRSRAAETRRRRSRRRLALWGSLAVIAAAIAGYIVYLAQPTPAPKPYVTQLLKGEYAQVPNACRLLSSSSLSQYLGGRPSKGVQTFSGAAKSECTYTFDVKPTFRVLDMTDTAYPPSLIAPGNGSATTYAIYNFGQTRQVLAKPPKGAAEPSATIATIGGLGDQAISAVQVFRIHPTTDRVTVLVRYRNVLITAIMSATVSGGFRSVPISQLEVDAQNAAGAILASLKTLPAVS